MIGLPDDERGEAVAAVLAMADPEEARRFDEAALRRKLKRELSSYKLPRRIVAVPGSRIPMLPSGKVDLRRLPEVFDG